MKDDAKELVAVDVLALVEDEKTAHPIVVLRDLQSQRLLPIWIGEPEARAIAISLDNVITVRPLTHHLILTMLQELGGALTHVVIDGLKNNTYFASVYVQHQGLEKKIDARPSDAVALALEGRVPLFVTKKIMDSSAQENPFSGPLLEPQEKPLDKPVASPKKLNLSEENIKRMKELLQKARTREQQSN